MKLKHTTIGYFRPIKFIADRLYLPITCTSLKTRNYIASSLNITAFQTLIDGICDDLGDFS